MANEDFNRIKKAIQDGLDSGVAKNFNPQKHLQALKVKKDKYSLKVLLQTK